MAKAAKRQEKAPKAQGELDPVAPLLARAEAAAQGAPPVTAEERLAYSGFFSEARCDRTGSHTESLGVLKDAVDWLPTIRDTLHARGGRLAGYPLRRFSFLSTCTVELGHAVLLLHQQQDAASGGHQRRGRLSASATVQRTALIALLGNLAGDEDVDERAELRTLTASPSSDEALASALGKLGLLGEKWLKRTDAAWRIRMEDQGLTPAVVQAAADTARDLLDAALGKPARASGDSPEVNRIEGRVILEMGVAMRAFAAARALDALVPKLTPGPGTRAVLAPKKGAAPIDVAPDPAPAPAEVKPRP